MCVWSGEGGRGGLVVRAGFLCWRRSWLLKCGLLGEVLAERLPYGYKGRALNVVGSVDGARNGVEALLGSWQGILARIFRMGSRCVC